MRFLHVNMKLSVVPSLPLGILGTCKNSHKLHLHFKYFQIINLYHFLATSADDSVMIFSYFSQKTGFDISVKLSPLETICMSVKTCSLQKLRQNNSTCRQLKVLSSLLSVKDHIDRDIRKRVFGIRGYKHFFMLNSAEHEICHANKSQNTNSCKFFLAKHS